MPSSIITRSHHDHHHQHQQSIPILCPICKLSHCCWFMYSAEQSALGHGQQMANITTSRLVNTRSAQNTLSSIDPINYHTEDTSIEVTTPVATKRNQCTSSSVQETDNATEQLNGLSEIGANKSCLRVHVMLWMRNNSFICRFPVLDDEHRFKSQSRFSTVAPPPPRYFHWSVSLGNQTNTFLLPHHSFTLTKHGCNNTRAHLDNRKTIALYN